MARSSRLWIVSRGGVALLAGYGMATLWCVALARILPFDQLDAVLLATMLSFIVYAVVAIAAFGIGSLARLLALLTIGAALAGALLLVAGR